ncbi:unnamed protein product [Candidula unifasciata]|uniref:[histone H3]-dimethyl-L-lysine(9) demethylase n=1 Tax=Candidula unifasciata TaxID=100452 RepID=A0A8S3YZ68_9EUPU|nr:unnamed protein product [Candidula unifasciata]
MHYKKQIIRAGGNISPSHNAQTPAVAECVDISRSLTDQLSKAKSSDKYSLNGDGKFKPEAGEIMEKTSSPSSSSKLSSYNPAEIERSEGNSFSKIREVKEDRQSAFTCVQPSVARSNPATPAALDRTDSRASDGQLSVHISDEKFAGSRCDEVRSIRSSPRTSPLVSDRHEAVNPYRDPELMRKNPVQSSVQNMLAVQHKINQSAFPSVHAPIPGATASSSQAPVTFAGVQTLPAGSLLSTLPYTTAHQLPPSLSHHLTLPHGYSMDAVVRAQHMAAMQQQHLMGLAMGPANTVASLEALWHHKFPTTPFPTPYMLQKNQDLILTPELAAALHREHFHLQLDHERRELERIEIERRERLEQELREKERKEILERERQEKEKAERDKIERERLERELLEKERERQKWELQQNQERVLDTEAAVDQHFAESLTRLASQQRISMFPNITGGSGRGLVPKTEPHHGLSSHGIPYEKMFEHRTDNQIKKEVELADEKRYIKPDCEKGSVFPGYAYGPGGYHPGSGMPQPGQKPFFNLYGYPSSHSTITPEQLKQRGLNPELKQAKEELAEKKHSYSSVSSHTATPVNLNQVYSSMDIKREPHNSVIVKRDIKLKMENPVAAHSHHSSSSSSSPRPQQPRPAHTPEHHRPDRPLASSTSPALGRHPHQLHHSSPVPADASHPPPSNNVPSFRSIEAHPPTRSQSPYKPAASQLQSQPLNFCKTSGANKLHEQQQHPSHVHSGFPSVAQLPVSVPSSASYSFSLIQQGLVPNPIYSHIGSSHPPGVSPQISQVSIAGQSSNSVMDSTRVQLSPPGSKRKTGSKDISSYSRKKPKGHPEVSVAGHPMSIPETTPQVFTNSSPYTTTTISGAGLLTKPGINSVRSSSSPSSVGTSHSQINSGFMDSFKSFVENTVQNAFLQDEKKAQETAERERMSALSLSPGIKSELNSHERKPDSSVQPVNGGSQLTASPATDPDVPQPSTVDSYNSRIMDTINRVANNQADTDSDTLSASSPPPHIKPSDTNSPLSRSGNGSGSSHPHHMKKAWLQRHDEDKKSETPVSTQCDEDSNSSLSHSRDTISCVENPSVPLPDCGQSSSSSPADVVVTLSNGNINDLSQHSDESTSSASESEMQSSSKTQKRTLSHRSGSGSSKKVRSSDVDKEETSPSRPLTPSSNSSNSNSSFQKKASSSKRGKTDKESKSKEKNTKMSASATASSSSPHSEHSNPSPALSESNTANMSPASSTSSSSNTHTTMPKLNSSSKDKKKSEHGKEHSRDSKKSSSFNKPLVKMTVSILKRTMMPFIQDGSCSEITPKLNKCRECKMTPIQRSKKQPNIFCRFYAFRRLKYNSRGIVTIHGFSELSDADPDDIEPWLPRYPVEEPELDVENSKFIIAKVGDKFCELVEQEKEAKSWAGDNVNIVWKRAVVGVREMCDVCDTTLFNMHWVCHKCGFVVCLDCYEVRIKESKKGCSDDKWLTCSSNRQAHKASEMMLTQIIPSDALWELGRLIHDIRMKWSIPSNCPCGGSNVENKVVTKNGINQLVNAVSTRKIPNGYGSEEHGGKNVKSKKHQDSDPLKNLDAYNPDNASSPLSILAEVASMEPDSNRDKSNVKRKADKSLVPEEELLEESDKKSGCSTLRELLTKTAGKPKGTNDKRSKKSSGLSTLDNIIQSVVEKSCSDGGAPFKFLHYTPRLGGWKRELPIMVHNLTETSVLYPDVPHSWLCDGRLLRLHDGHHKGNLQIFQEQWKRGQPVLVSCANKKMNINIWKPEVFTKEFGHIENEVVNCRTGDVIIGHTMGDFWGGFENLANRPIDSKGHPMLLKLKDWPPGDDFSELLPSRFHDLMNALPLPEYTQRNGKLNLASRLPDFLVRPDLGPKMYNAYGSSQFPQEGTTNLHLDISDAVNVMVYVGIPSDGPGGRTAQEEAAVKAIDDAGCDSITKRRVREVHEIPGALWHIYDAHDADKIRDFLNKVAKERGESIEKDHDAIHDQSWYLDKELCDRLLKEYGVQGYTIVQCLGDAIFIPAGAPHQVRNLHSCIKVAEDFVSPEHLNHCFRLTQEFRQLSETHTNHEDKLQVKNIIYHAVKDAIAVLREHSPDDE